MSSEHEVSQRSAANILRHLSPTRCQPYQIGITKEGDWFLFPGTADEIEDGSWVRHPENRPVVLSANRSCPGLLVLENNCYTFLKVDLLFPVLHGKNGEDGSIQGLFTLSGIPYVGCDILSSAVCMDKAVTHSLLSSVYGVEMTNYLWFYRERYRSAPEKIKDKIEARLRFPVFVKPAKGGSSVGVSRVTEKEALDAAIAKAALEDEKIIVENAIQGRELECAVLGNQDPSVSGVGEIITDAEFYDYQDKYISGTARCVIPAALPETLSREIQQAALRAYRHLGCSGLARVDFFLTEEGQVILNEINTLPGFTAISMYPQLWQAAGLDYASLLDRIMDHALACSDPLASPASLPDSAGETGDRL